RRSSPQPSDRSGQYPLLVPQHWDCIPARIDAVDVYLRPADHEVRVDARRIVRARGELFIRIAREAEPAAVGDVAGRVLVEERVEERHAGPADRRRPVDKSDLAEPARTVVAVELRLNHLFALVGLRLD